MYKSKATQPKESGGSWEAGPYRFKIESAVLHSEGNIMMKLKTKTEGGKDGPDVIEWLNLTSDKTGAIDELDRRLQTILGKMAIDSPNELVGKTGYIILRKGEKYLEAMPFGGFYDNNRKSATGKESMSDRIAEALKYKFVSTSSSVGDITEDDIPF